MFTRTLLVLFLLYSSLLSQENTHNLDAVEKQPQQFIDAFYLGYGINAKDHSVYRLGITKNFSKKYFESARGYLSGFYDLSLNEINYSKSIYAVAFSPVFAYYFKNNSNYDPYIYGGIGGSFISHTKIQEKTFSTAFQFEDRIGFGLHHQSFDITLGYFHYSNADIKKPNNGMDIGMFCLHYNF